MTSKEGFALVFVASIVQCVMTSCPDVYRDEWGAHPPVLSPLNLTVPAPFVVIHHTYIPSACNSSGTCIQAMKKMQHMHQISNRWNDIGYNFGIGGDGLVYEGRGWDVVGAHAPKYNFMSIGICFIGDYRTEVPPTTMLDAARALIQCGVDRGSILANYTLVGHRQVRNTECPGGALFQEIQTWPHWEPIKDIQPRVPQTPYVVQQGGTQQGTTTETTTTTTTTSVPSDNSATANKDEVLPDTISTNSNNITENVLSSNMDDVIPDNTVTTTNNIAGDVLSSNTDDILPNNTERR